MSGAASGGRTDLHWNRQPRAGVFSLSSLGGEGRGEEAVFCMSAERFIESLPLL